MDQIMTLITIDEFKKIDIRAGQIVKAENFLEARKAAYKLSVDFGPEVGILAASAQITINYTIEQLIGQYVLGVVNFPSMKIASFKSEALILGFWDDSGAIVLATPERAISLGARLT